MMPGARGPLSTASGSNFSLLGPTGRRDTPWRKSTAGSSTTATGGRAESPSHPACRDLTDSKTACGRGSGRRGVLPNTVGRPCGPMPSATASTPVPLGALTSAAASWLASCRPGRWSAEHGDFVAGQRLQVGCCHLAAGSARLMPELRSGLLGAHGLHPVQRAGSGRAPLHVATPFQHTGRRRCPGDRPDRPS